MDSWLVDAALLSAALHAAWNAAFKANPDPAQAMTGQMVDRRRIRTHGRKGGIALVSAPQ